MHIKSVYRGGMGTPKKTKLRKKKKIALKQKNEQKIKQSCKMWPNLAELFICIQIPHAG